MLSFVANIVKAVGAFLIFGYFEFKFSYGYIVIFLLSLHLVRRKVYLAAPVALCQYALVYYKQQKLGYLFFLILDMLIFCDTTVADNAKVTYRPFEKELREFLLKHDSSKLHIVDSWLDQYKGREKQLLRLLHDRYSSQSRTSDNPKSSNNPFSSEEEEEEDSKSVAVFQMTVREKIYRVLRNNKLTKHMDQLMSTYRDRETELLDILQNDSNLSSFNGAEGAIQTDSINHREIVDNAMWKARTNISARVDAASKRGKAQAADSAKK